MNVLAEFTKILVVGMLIIIMGNSCNQSTTAKSDNRDTELLIPKDEYAKKLYGFWLGQCIGNWTGLITEMDKIGNVGQVKTGDFYTRDNWGQGDQPNIWSDGSISDISPVIDFVIVKDSGVWGADDDTDIEYMYQHILLTNNTSRLTPDQIREGWLTHIKAEEENYLWVSNQQAFDLMQEGKLPPETSDPLLNPHFDMIDAQLTTEIFGLFAPGRPDIALEMAFLPIRTTAREEAASIAEFYVIMHSLAAKIKVGDNMKEQVLSIADQARAHLPDTTYPAAMYDFVKSMYERGEDWEVTRDSLYQRYQVEEADGYNITSRELYCNGCFAAGINFGASIISLIYGEGNFKETVKIGSLCGWDSDNPTATWAGLLGFIIGKAGIEKEFSTTFSNRFNIHRTRQNFLDGGIDTFENMAEIGIKIVNLSIEENDFGYNDEVKNAWIISIGN